MKATSDYKDAAESNQNFTNQLPDFNNMTLMLYEPENIQLLYNITDISINNLYADPDRFSIRTEEKYGLYEMNLDKMDMNISLNYDLMLIPPIFVDKGSFSFYCEDVSLNAVWSLNLNSSRNFFDLIISHVLAQINPEKFELDIESQSDLTIMINQQIDLIVQYTLNEILAFSRYNLGVMI